MKNKLILLAMVIAVFFADCTHTNNPPSEKDPNKKDPTDDPPSITLGQDDLAAYYVETPPLIDGSGDDAAWEKAKWQPIKYEWMYNTPPNITPVKNAQDFSGKFKVVWTAERLYILAEITDDVISFTRGSTPYDSPQNDDCLELFIDENASGGARASDGGNNFFTYHMSYGGLNISDYIGGNSNTTNDPTTHIENGNILRNSHINYKIGKNDATHTYIWEAEMKVYNNTYPLRSSPDTTPVSLTAGKKMGFAVAYCDADAKGTREHFIGSMFVTGNTDNERNSSYLNSDQYAKLYLVNDDYTIKPNASTDSIVSLVRSSKAQASSLIYDDILALTREAVNLAGGLEGIVKAGDTVALKPNVIVTGWNWGTPSGANHIPELVNGVCTDRRVIQAVAEIVREIVGPSGKIMVIEGSGSGSTAVNFANLGYTLANFVNVDEIIALENEGTWNQPGTPPANDTYNTQVTLPEPFYTTAVGNNTFYRYYKNDGKYWVNKKMLNADALICIPVVKSHWNAVVTGSIKNIGIGATPPRIYGRGSTDVGRNDMVDHNKTDLMDWIADYFSVLPADFVVMDGLQGLEYGPLPQVSSAAELAAMQKNLRCMLASRDPLAIDTVMSNIIGWDYAKVRYLTKLAERGEVFARGEIGKPDPRKIPLRGDPQNIVVLGNVTVDDVRGDYASGGYGNPADVGGAKISSAQKTPPTVTINSAVFSKSSLNLSLTLSTGANNNVVKTDVYIDGKYAASFKNGMTNVSLDASSLADGSHSIEARAYNQYMRGASAVTTATK